MSVDPEDRAVRSKSSRDTPKSKEEGSGETDCRRMESGQRSHNSQDARKSPLLYGWRLCLVQIGLCLALFLGGIDSSIVATALVTIGKDFNDFIKLQWVILAYLLTYLGFALIFSRVSDVVGRKWTSIAALLILMAGSLGCGFAQTLNELIALRAIQGIGGSGVYAMSLTAAPEITPPEKFQLVSGLAAIAITCSSVLGPILGGVITTQSTWRWTFWFNGPPAALAILLLAVAWPESHSPGRIPWRRLDLVGGTLFGSASVLLVFALQQGGATVYLWNSSIIIGCLIGAGLSAVVVAFWIWFLSARDRLFAPIFPARIVTRKGTLLNVIQATLSGYLLFTTVVEIPERLQVVNGKTAQGAGISLLPYLCSASLASFVVVGLTSSSKNLSSYTPIGASAFAILGSGLLSSIDYSASLPASFYGYEVLLGFGLGGLLVSPIIGVKAHAREEDSASAQGLTSQMRILGGNVGLSLATVIQNAHIGSDLSGILSPQQISNLRQSLNTVETFTPQEVAAVGLSFARSFRTQLQVCTAIAGLSLIIALFSWEKNPPSMLGVQRSARREKKPTDAEAGGSELHS